MLNKSDVINYIKTNLGFPHVTIEKSDQQFWDYARMYTLREFSLYVPDWNEIVMKMNDPKIKTDVKNIFLIRDPDGCNIHNVAAVVSQEQDTLMHGSPYQSIYQNFMGLESMLTSLEQGETAEHFSRSEPIYEFIVPNKLRLWHGSTMPSYVVCRYERSQPESLEKIPYEREIDFLELCLADAMIILGNIRQKYRELTTSFGSIPISDDIYNKGTEKKNLIIEKLKALPPNVILEIG